MKRIVAWLLLSVTLLAPLSAQAAKKSVPMVEPAPVVLPAGSTTAGAIKAIKVALATRQWAATKETPNFVEGTLAVRAHTLRIGLTVTANQIVIKYIDSTQLGYEEEDGQRLIHPKFHTWTNALVAEINKNLLLLQG